MFRNQLTDGLWGTLPALIKQAIEFNWRILHVRLQSREMFRLHSARS